MSRRLYQLSYRPTKEANYSRKGAWRSSPSGGAFGAGVAVAKVAGLAGLFLCPAGERLSAAAHPFHRTRQPDSSLRSGTILADSTRPSVGMAAGHADGIKRAGEGEGTDRRRPAGPCPLRRRKLRASTAGIQGSPSPSKKAPQTQKAPCRHGAGRLVSFASAAGYWAGVSSMSMTRPCSQM